MLIRIEAFGRTLRVELGKDSPAEPHDVPYDAPTPMVVYADDRHEYSRDYVGFVSRVSKPPGLK